MGKSIELLNTNTWSIAKAVCVYRHDYINNSHLHYWTCFYNSNDNYFFPQILFKFYLCCTILDALWPLRKTQVIISCLIPKICSFPATPALKRDILRSILWSRWDCIQREIRVFLNINLICDNSQILGSSIMWIQDEITNLPSGLTPCYTQNGVS